MLFIKKIKGLQSALQILYYLTLGFFFVKKSRQSENKNLLLITSNFLPDINGGVYRPLAILRYSELEDIKIIALCEESPLQCSPQASYLLGLIPESVKIFRSKPHLMFFPYRLGRLFSDSFKQMISMFENASDIITTKNIDTVLCTGPKFYTFIVGAVLKRKYGVKLILDYRDEWSDNPFSFVVKSRFDRYFENKALRIADAIVFTTESQAQHCIDKCSPDVSKKIRVIYNGIDLDYVDERGSQIDNSSTVTISYAGSLEGHSSFGSFVQDFHRILEKREDLREIISVQIYGNISKECMRYIDDFPFKSCLSHLGMKTTAEITNILNRSSATILFLNENFRRYIPGKLFDYISCGNPIVVYGLEGESEISKLMPNWISLYCSKAADSVSLEHSLDQLISNQDVRLPSFDSERSTFIDKYSREKMALEFFNLIKSL